jgi:hypothetical protein
MAQMGVNTMIIDQKHTHTRCGRADGLESRTLEILDSFGLADQIWTQANHTVEIALWVPPPHTHPGPPQVAPSIGKPNPLTQLSWYYAPGRWNRWEAAKAKHQRKFQARVVAVS